MTRPEQSTTLVEMMQSLLGEEEDKEDLLAKIVRLGLQAIMEAERDLHVGVDRYERSEERQTSRNGYKPRQWTTRVGTLDLGISNWILPSLPFSGVSGSLQPDMRPLYC